MKTFKTTSLADQVFEKLEQDIITGNYPAGEVLTELKLAEQLGVSRTPIREALRRLQQERLIEEAGKGSVVLGITQEDLLDIMEIRQHIEPLASRHAAENISGGELEELQHVVQLQEFYCQNGDLEHLNQMDAKFHQIICTASGRPVIRDTLIPLHRRTTRFRKAALTSQEHMQNMVKEHREIFDAIASRDAQQAAHLTQMHIRSAKHRMIERMTENG